MANYSILDMVQVIKIVCKKIDNWKVQQKEQNFKERFNPFDGIRPSSLILLLQRNYYCNLKFI